MTASFGILLIMIALIFAIIALTLSAFGSAIRIRSMQAVLDETKQASAEWESVATQRISIAHQYRSAARIIAIHRNGRVVHITVARGDDIFTIETMGLMSDNLPEWRAKCGFPPE